MRVKMDIPMIDGPNEGLFTGTGDVLTSMLLA